MSSTISTFNSKGGQVRNLKAFFNNENSKDYGKCVQQRGQQECLASSANKKDFKKDIVMGPTQPSQEVALARKDVIGGNFGLKRPTANKNSCYNTEQIQARNSSF